MIADIARRVAKTGRYTETAELMAKAMHEQGYSAAKIQAEVMKLLNADPDYKMFVAENTNAYKKEIQRIIKETVEKAKEAGDELVAEAGDMAWNADLSMWSEQGVDLKKPNSMSQLREAFTKQTVNELRNLTRTTGFRNVNTGTVGIMNAYQRELDLALLKVATGTFAYDQAVKDCVHRLAQSGLRSIDYASGRSYQLDTAARMCVRTGMSQLAGKIMEENLKSTGQDLVITSQHMGSRPEHAPWQNKVFSYSGKNKRYPDFFKETGYGTVTGLKGANCTHDFYPFWEGISVIPEDLKVPDPVTINGKEYTYYECTQKQRSMERDIRALKREINASEALGIDTTELRSKLKLKTSEYGQFSVSAHLRTKENRLRVQAGSSNLNKTKVVKKYKNDIIKKNRLNSIADPMADAFGAGESSHPKEIKAFREELKMLNVELIERKTETLGYAPGLRRGEVGTAYISKGASYSAWCHEMQHVRDDYEDGWLGMSILADPDKRFRREMKAYEIEINLAKEAGRDDLAKQLEANLEEERKNIYGY